MNNHLLTHIEIKNFKCFDSFKVEGFKRVNLISGKNNVGKTALMEACYLNLNECIPDSFKKIKMFRHFLNPVTEKKVKDVQIKSNIIAASAEFAIYSDRVINNNIFFITNFSHSYKRIIKNYASVQKKDQESLLNSAIHELDSNIESFKVIDDTPQCKINGHYLELAEFGDGLKHLVSIITALFKTENGYLFIDEIGSGIHYTQLEQLWEIVLEHANAQNVQVFATTHSKECIEAYARTAQKLNRQDIAFIRLSQLQNGEIKASVFDYDLLQNSMEQDHEVRGW